MNELVIEMRRLKIIGKPSGLTIVNTSAIPAGRRPEIVHRGLEKILVWNQKGSILRFEDAARSAVTRSGTLRAPVIDARRPTL